MRFEDGSRLSTELDFTVSLDGSTNVIDNMDSNRYRSRYCTSTEIRFFKRIVLLGLIVLVLLVSSCHGSANLTTMQTVIELPYPRLFVFGDSLVAAGNNKFVPLSLARGDYPPNGIDFVEGATGRFCNGRTISDVWCDLIGISYPPPSRDPNTTIAVVIQKGANFGSAGAGILDSTFMEIGPLMPMNRQIEYFNATVVELNSKFGSAQSSKFLAKAVCLSMIGSNDILNNYWAQAAGFSLSPARLLYSPTQFIALLIHALGEQLTTLYNLGLRKFIIAGLSPLGNTPSVSQRSLDNTGDLRRKVNAHAMEFNVRGLTFGLLPQLAKALPGAKLLYADVYNTFDDIWANANSLGLKEIYKGCCEGLICVPFEVPCNERNSYAFWDGLHPAEAINVLLGNRMFNGASTLYEGDKVFRMTVKQLMELQDQ